MIVNEISVIGMGYQRHDLSAGGSFALSSSPMILMIGDVDFQLICDLAPMAEVKFIQALPKFLSLRRDFYMAAADEVLALADSTERLAIPVLGNPFVIEGVSAALRKSAHADRVAIYPGPSIIEKLLCSFPELLKGHGFRVLDAGAEFFAAKLDPNVDLVLLQFGRVGSVRHTFTSAPSRDWLQHCLCYIGMFFPKSAAVSLITFSLDEMSVFTGNLEQIGELHRNLSQATSIIVHSPFKPRPDTEVEVLRRIVSPLELAGRL